MKKGSTHSAGTLAIMSELGRKRGMPASAIQAARRVNLGRRQTEEHRQRLADAAPGRRPVEVEGVRYPSCNAASKTTGVPLSTLIKRLGSANYSEYLYIEA